MADFYDQDIDDFKATLEELNITGEQADWYLREYREKNSPLSAVYSTVDTADQALEDEGRRRLNILPLSVPKGKSGFDALREGSWEFAVPGLAIGITEGTAKGLDAPGAALEGSIPEKDLTMEALGTAGTVASRVPFGEYSPHTTSIFGGYKAAKNPGKTASGAPAPTSIGADMLQRFEIDDSKAEFISNVNTATVVNGYNSIPSNSTKLSDFLKHDELFAQYPDIADIKFVIDNSLASNEYGWALDGKVIAVNPKLLSNPDELMNTTIHELQHTVQAREGFTGGTNTDAPEVRQYAYTEIHSPENKQAWDSFDNSMRLREAPKVQHSYASTFDGTIPILAKSYGLSEKDFMSFDNPTTWGKLKMKFSKLTDEEKAEVATLSSALNRLRGTKVQMILQRILVLKTHLRTRTLKSVRLQSVEV